MVAIIVFLVINTIISLAQVGLFYFCFVRKKPSLPQEQEAKEETQKTFLTEKQLREWLLGEGK